MAGTYTSKQLMHIPQTFQKSKAADLLLHCMFDLEDKPSLRAPVNGILEK
jgi:hypothetical protein